jgi:hypothetical protein
MEKLQLTYGLMVSVLLIAYMVILIAAVVASVEQLKNGGTQTAASAQATPAAAQATPTAAQSEQNALAIRDTPQAQAGVAGWVERAFRAAWGAVRNAWNFVISRRNIFPPIIVLVTALGFVLPPKAKIQEAISLAATNYLCLIHYLNWGERSHAIGGKLESLLEHLVEREKGYGKIHIIGYSFGSIVALDNLFASGRKPIDRFRRIDTLVTIGCPFDIIRTYWPEYFNGRQSLTADTPKWINVYSPIDILSSNFADSGNDQPVDEEQRKDIGIKLADGMRKPENIVFLQGPQRRLGIVDVLTLTGFRAHSMYWGEEVKGEITCFHDVIRMMYQGTPVLD